MARPPGAQREASHGAARDGAPPSCGRDGRHGRPPVPVEGSRPPDQACAARVWLALLRLTLVPRPVPRAMMAHTPRRALLAAPDVFLARPILMATRPQRVRPASQAHTQPAQWPAGTAPRGNTLRSVVPWTARTAWPASRPCLDLGHVLPVSRAGLLCLTAQAPARSAPAARIPQLELRHARTVRSVKRIWTPTQAPHAHRATQGRSRTRKARLRALTARRARFPPATGRLAMTALPVSLPLLGRVHALAARRAGIPTPQARLSARRVASARLPLTMRPSATRAPADTKTPTVIRAQSAQWSPAPMYARWVRTTPTAMGVSALIAWLAERTGTATPRPSAQRVLRAPTPHRRKLRIALRAPLDRFRTALPHAQVAPLARTQLLGPPAARTAWLVPLTPTPTRVLSALPAPLVGTLLIRGLATRVKQARSLRRQERPHAQLAALAPTQPPAQARVRSASRAGMQVACREGRCRVAASRGGRRQAHARAAAGGGP